jgi:IS5 family transposase
MRQSGLFGLSEHLKRLSAHGDPLEELGRIIDFEAFRATFTTALAYGNGSKGGRPPYDPLAMLKVLILAAQNNVSDARTEYLIRDRLSWLRFLGFDLGVATPDANTIRLFREKLTEAGALDTAFTDFDRQLKERGYLAMGGPIVDATLVAAPKQRNTQGEKAAIKEGKKAGEIWPDEPARAAQKDPAYRSQANEKWLKAQGRVSRVHRKKPRGKPMPDHVRRGNAAKSKVRARVEHLFAQQKAKMGPFIRTIGIKRAQAKITLANLAYNLTRLIFHERRAVMG